VKILVVEDMPETTQATADALAGDGHTILEARSVEAARELLDAERVDCVLLDQYLPISVGGREAAAEEVFSLAKDISEGGFDANKVPLYFIWVTAHEVPSLRSEIPGCLGAVPKEGNTTEEVERRFSSAIEGFFDAVPPDAIRDQVLLEVQRDAGGGLRVCVPAWREEDFAMPLDQLPKWVARALDASGGIVYLRARANLRAERPGQLDLGHHRLVPEIEIDEEELWDG
jgi:CheY-like chemotaxis protein